MGFTEAVQVCLGKFVDFSGRASRSEFWWWTLFVVVIPVVLIVVAGTVDVIIGVPLLTMLAVLFLIALLLPTLGVSIRRLHDTGRSGWWLLIDFVPFGGLYLLYLYVQPSSVEANRFGAPPVA